LTKREREKEEKQNITRATLATIELDAPLIHGGDTEMFDHHAPGITLLKERWKK
jgi:hypothetical protein